MEKSSITVGSWLVASIGVQHHRIKENEKLHIVQCTYMAIQLDIYVATVYIMQYDKDMFCTVKLN